MTAHRLPYVEGAVIVSGRVASTYSRILSSPKVAQVLDQIGDPEEIATRAALRKAAKRFSHVRAVERKSEAWDEGVDPSLALIGTAEAAHLLRMSRRRVQQLAAGGLGQKVAGQWRLGLDVVTDLAERRRTSGEAERTVGGGPRAS